MHSLADCAQTRLLLLLVLHVFASLSITVEIDRIAPHIDAKKRIELRSRYLQCFLNDIVRISVPVVTDYDNIYLTKPNGDNLKLNLSLPKSDEYNRARASIDIYERKIKAETFPEEDFYMFKEIGNKIQHVHSNEFLLGPLLERDYGNWAVTIYTKDTEDEWIEMYQIFTLAITDFIPVHPKQPTLSLGDTFRLSFAYPVLGIETCEVTPPSSTFDRFYTRSNIDFNKCSFVIPNVTKADAGEWKIIGVGRIIYEGYTILAVI